MSLDAARHAPKLPAGIAIARLREGTVEVATAGPVAADAVFELGSITKAVTGLLLADAVVRGEVGLDTTLDECLEGARALRLGDLATHTSGLPRLPLALLRRVGFTNVTDPYAATTVPELVADLASVRLRRPRVRYSNLGGLAPPPAMAEAVALALTPRAGGRVLEVGLGWLRAPAHRGTKMWWHNGGTNGSRSFTAFIPEQNVAVAAVSNGARGVEGAAKASW